MYVCTRGGGGGREEGGKGKCYQAEGIKYCVLFFFVKMPEWSVDWADLTGIFCCTILTRCIDG